MNSFDLELLQTYLCYFHVAELKEVCVELGISISGMKGDLIDRILSYLKRDKIPKTNSIPEVSKAKKGVDYPLNSKTKILKGSYKNNRATREFFIKLIGEHFHFTAYGQDWIRKKWSEGTPPTYGEFAAYWKSEFESRKREKAKPKKEWAYLNFVQRCAKEHPEFSKAAIGKAWKHERSAFVKKAKAFLKQFRY